MLARRIVLVLVRHAHPAEEDGASLVHAHMRHEEVEAAVELLELTVQHLASRKREMTHDVARLEEVLPVELASFQAARREEEHIVLAEGEERRAFPDLAEEAELRPQLSREAKEPLLLAIEEETSPRIVRRRRLCAQKRVGVTVPHEEMRSLEEVGIPFGLLLDEEHILLDDAFLRQGAEDLAIRAPALFLSPSRVEDAQHAAVDEGGAGAAAVLVVVIRRPQDELGIGPIDEVARLEEDPALVLVLGRKGIPLAEEMVLAPKENEPLHTAREAERQLQMKAVAPAVTRMMQLIFQARVKFLLVVFHRCLLLSLHA